MKLVTWNVNSLRIRMAHLEALINEVDPDVVCLQETKVRDELFPSEEVSALGLTHHYFRGEKSYNGVAILSKTPLNNMEHDDFCGREDKRHIRVELKDGVILDNFYIPAGGDEPDAEKNPKFAHKLQFLNEMAENCSARYDANTPRIMVGDFNIAPFEHDVWDHKKLKNIITHTQTEIAHLKKVQDAGHWVDVMRNFIPPEEKCFTWWSYRARDWQASNKGRRLDHIWVTPDLGDKVKAIHVMENIRGLEKPSDHAPVLMEIDL